MGLIDNIQLEKKTKNKKNKQWSFPDILMTYKNINHGCFCIEAIPAKSPPHPLKRNTFLNYPGFVKKSTHHIWEVLFFFVFQYSLQQYRHHRLHSFTNTKHTTILAADAAAVKGKWSGSVEISSIDNGHLSFIEPLLTF